MMCRLAAACLLAFVGFQAGCISDSRQLLERAEARWREGQYDDAIRLNTLLYERERQGKYAARALFNIGNIYYLNLRRIKDAIEAYDKLVEELPGLPEEVKARQQLAAIYANEIGDMAQAIREYDKILEAPDLENRAEVRFERANAYFSLEDYDRALRELRQLEESGVSGHLADRVHLKIGNTYQIRNKFEDAVASFQKVVESPCMECRRRAIIHLMQSYESLYDFDRAIESIRKLDRTPENESRIAREVVRLREKHRKMDSGVVLRWARHR